MARIIRGKKIAADIHERQARRARELTQKLGRKPGLTVILAGDNPASVSYVSAKERACERAGIECQIIRPPAQIERRELLEIVRRQNAADAVDGIIVQLPLPPNLVESEILAAIAPQKDVDGLHPQNLGKLLAGEDAFVPATPAAVRQILIAEKTPTEGKNATVVGRSRLVGMPLAALLASDRPGGNATVTICHSRTADLSRRAADADVLIGDVGKPNLIRGADIKPGAVVIDVGVNRVADASAPSGYKLVGDVAFDEALETASAITPVPGGVGPMTIAMLLENVLKSAASKK